MRPEIVEAGGDYILAVKGNQETLQEDVEANKRLKAAWDWSFLMNLLQI